MRLNFGRILRKAFQFHPFIAHLFVPVLRAKDLLHGHAMRQDMEKNIRIFCSPEAQGDPRRMRRMKRDMWYSFLQYNCGFDEYFLFDFPSLSHQGRSSFICDNERSQICLDMVTAEVRSLFKNKWKTYETFHVYYKRDAILVDNTGNFEDFDRFARKHPRFIVKPLTASCGRGIHIVDTTNQDLSEVFRNLKDTPCIVEEIICQSEEMARLHPASVNSVRCATFMTDGVPHILFAFIRIGSGASIVDNAGSGGLFATVNLETGIVETPAVTEFGDSYLIHPDTGVQLIGMRIPRWDELIETAKSLATIVPTQQYVGWDLALTDAGWVMVEGNCAGQFVSQIPSRAGIRPLLRPYFDL